MIRVVMPPLYRTVPVLLATIAMPAASRLLVDTVGWTDRDLQFYGPALRYLVYDTTFGTHVVWKNGYGEIRYNHCPRHGTWRWPTGTVINRFQRNLGCLDIDVRNGWAYISTDYLWRGRPVISYFADSAAGAGSFRETRLAYDRRHNLVAASDRGYPKFAALSADSIYYYGYFGGVPLGEVGPFPSHNLAVSKQSGRFGYIWTTNQGPHAGRLYLKQTPNNGANWYATVSLSDSVPSTYNRSLLGACATYDTIRLHLIADLYDGTNRYDVVFWHYCPYLSPPWHVALHVALPDTTPIGTRNLAACRPSIGLDRRRQEFYIVWEQFDPGNIDPRTGLARADIWASRSRDYGCTWGDPQRLTGPDSVSHRFPFLAEVVDETLRILCFGDRVAGVWEQGEGEQTVNPVLLLRIPADRLPVAVGEQSAPIPSQRPPGHKLVTGTGLGFSESGSLKLVDATGRIMLAADSPTIAARRTAAGVYFAILKDGLRTRVVRILRTR